MRISEGMVSPKYYGLTYYDYVRREAVCHPIPLNIIFGIGVNIWHRIRSGVSSWLANKCSESYSQGFNDATKRVIGMEDRAYDRGLNKGRIEGWNDNFDFTVSSAGKTIKEVEELLPDWHPHKGRYK